MVSKRCGVTVIATVYNEASNIDEWLTGLLSQSLQPDEIIIVDGGSTDDTVAAITHHVKRSTIPITLIESPGVNISRGRNLAIERARSNVIAVTDAGTRADPHWLQELVAPLVSGDADVAAGFFVPRLASRWERALAATTLPDATEIDHNRFQPSSRSMAFKRSWLEARVRYPEWLDYCEDLVWDLAMRRAGARFTFVPEALVTFSVRPSPSSFAIQYARYARGDGKAGLFPRRHALRYVTYSALLIVLTRHRPLELVGAMLLGCAYCARPIMRLRTRDREAQRPVHDTIATIPLVVALRGLGDLSKLAGYPVGLGWRWRTFGGIGWRTSWRRISPSGEMFLPAVSTRESRPLAASPAGESHAEWR